MFEKVNQNHPDKIANRIAGAIVDLAYTLEENPKIAVECLIGHKNCSIIIESSTNLNEKFISNIVYRILETKDISIDYFYAKQDKHLALNQKGRVALGITEYLEECQLQMNKKNLPILLKLDIKH